MSTVRIYYSREDQDYDNYNLWYMPGRHMGNPDLLDPDHTYQNLYNEAPRIKKDFTVSGNYGYVDVDLNGANNCDFYIRRKDFLYDLDENVTYDPESIFWMTGFIYSIQENLYDDVYVKENKPYLYKDSFFQAISPMAITLSGDDSYTDTDDILHEDGREHGEEGEGWWWTHYKIFNTHENSTTIEIPQSVLNQILENENMDTIMTILMLNLCGKTYTIGEDMQLSIDADALSAEKADALQMVDKAIANCLYKVGEVPADFDEDAFIADFDTYKAGKSEVLENTVDYLKELLETRPNLV